MLVLLIILVAFTGAVASMHVLVLTSVATTSRAYDTYRQGSSELARLEHVVAESLLDMRQISVAPAFESLPARVDQHLTDLAGGTATTTATSLPLVLPNITTFPANTGPADPLTAIPDDLIPFLTPELAALVGQRVAAYPALDFDFSSQRTVLDVSRTCASRVTARLIAAPLTRFPIAAYELPSDVGTATASASIGPASALPAGIVPARDPAFVADLQAQPGVLPYHYRRRAEIAAAYQYVFSQAFIDRVAEYAGVTHFCALDATNGTAVLAGMSQVAGTTNWDLGVAGAGTYNTITLTSDAAVVFTETAGHTLHLYDSAAEAGATPLFLLILGPSNTALGPLTLDLATIVRPVVIVGYNVRVTAASGVAMNGALFLDPASSMAPSAPMTVAHLSYWAGATSIPENAVVSTGLMPPSAEDLAPRVVYVATTAIRL